MKNFGYQQSTTQRRLEHLIRHLSSDRNSSTIVEKSMDVLRFNSIHIQDQHQVVRNSSRDEKLLLLQHAKQLFKQDSKQVIPNENDNNANEDVSDGTGPFVRLFDHFGIYLPLPLDLAQVKTQPNDFQFSLFHLNIPEISENETQASAEGLISKIQHFTFTQIQETSMGYVISVYINLLKGNYETVLEQIQHIKVRLKTKPDYVLIYLESLCRFLLQEYDTALLLCDNCINIMLNGTNMIENEENPNKFLIHISKSLTETPQHIRIQPLVLYSWILFHLYEFSHAEKVLVTCCEEIFPFNAEAHFNYSQLLAAIHGCSNQVAKWNLDEEIFEKMNSHMKQCIELYIHEDISVPNTTNVVSPKQSSNLPQSPYYSLFKYWNYYLHFLSHCPNNSTLLDHNLQFIENFVYKSLLEWYGIDYKQLLDDKISTSPTSTLINNKKKSNTLQNSILHPIDLAFLLVACARCYALNCLRNQDEENFKAVQSMQDVGISKAQRLYRIASNLELIAYTQFNHKSTNSDDSPKHVSLVFYCKRLACTELFSISREFNNFKHRFLLDHVQ
ncbi:hypothetical protein C9374_009521 [Naegleria lovaniensis]|uniref:Uncharacterized protein n=1 Tax=Naegleria lovaniensis TaxID=51637 RepID=A0AA88H3G2_NAELO|nr:uncharacterized protein C9374_009521 [Naegleria lovaniensis]KAG2392944.1 hypothetical protein C9374_009521 [Naegleria lovaniensis]